MAAPRKPAQRVRPPRREPPVAALRDARLVHFAVGGEFATRLAGEFKAKQNASAMADALKDFERTGEIVIGLPLAEALQFAINHHQQAEHRSAERAYRAVLRAEPDHARANHFYGVLLHQTGRSQEAARRMRRVMPALADQPWAWNNFGNVLKENAATVDEARTAYEKALSINPGLADAHNNLGIVHFRADRRDEALAAYKRAIELNPDHAGAHCNLGNLQVEQGAVREGLLSLARAIVLNPRDPSQPRMHLAIAHVRLGDTAAAARVYREWSEAEPENPRPRYLLAACVGDGPPRAAEDYLIATFDNFADDFDVKLARLDYRGPTQVGEALARATSAGASFGAICDAGCGTGLCGPLVRERATKLVGVDLSPGMLAKARERDIYDELHERELTAFLATQDAAFDSLISADTLIYFGALDEFARVAHAALKPGGVLAVTAESLPDGCADPFRILPSGRYAHSRAYLQRSLAAAGFSVEAIVSEPVRNESALPVMGFVVTARKAV